MSITIPLENVEVLQDDSAKFTVQLSKPNQKVEWFIGGKKLVPSDKYVIENHDLDYTLTIHKCSKKEDLAEVSLTVGKNKTTGQLHVLGK